MKTRFRSEVKAITGQRGAFTLTLGDGATVTADQVVLASACRAMCASWRWTARTATG